MPEMPDWLRALALMGKHGTDYVVIAVDALGQLFATIKGEDSEGALHILAVDDEGQLIMVPRGAEGNYLAVDGSGYLTTVIKGKYGEALRTITLDDAGRLSAYVYDSVDAWGQIASVGFAELAARLGSVVRYERSGQVHWIETFESGLQRWTKALEGDKANIAISSHYSQSGGYSCLLVGGEDGSRTATIKRLCGVNPEGKLGLSFSFALNSNFEWIKLSFYLRTTGVEHQPILWLPPSLDHIYIYTDTPEWVEVCDLDLATINPETWNTIKLVVDFETSSYVSVRFNAGTHDMSAHDFTSDTGAYTPEVMIEIQAKSIIGETNHIYIDDVILTFAEP